MYGVLYIQRNHLILNYPKSQEWPSFPFTAEGKRRVSYEDGSRSDIGRSFDCEVFCWGMCHCVFFIQ